MVVGMENLLIFVGALCGVALGAIVGSYFADGGASQVSSTFFHSGILGNKNSGTDEQNDPWLAGVA